MVWYINKFNNEIVNKKNPTGILYVIFLICMSKDKIASIQERRDYEHGGNSDILGIRGWWVF